MNKVLILYAKERSGHHMAALALAKAFQQRAPEADVRCQRVEEFLNPVVSRLSGRIYMFVIRRLPFLWEWVYDNDTIKRRVKAIKQWKVFLANTKLFRYLKRWQPDLIACTQAVPCEMVCLLKERGKIDTPLLAVPTDYHVHSYWLLDAVDRFCVATEKGAAHVLANGIPEEKIFVTGIPISDAFRKPVDISECRLKLGLDSDRPVVVLMGGGRGLIPFHKILRALLKLRPSVQIVPIIGAGKTSRRTKWQASRHEESVQILQYVDNIHEVMSLADVIVSKPGGMTSAEVMAKHVPFVIVNPLPGQEKHNQLHLVAENAAMLALDEKDVARKVQAILNAPGISSRLKAASSRVARPDAAERVVEVAAVLLGESEEPARDDAEAAQG